jgi:uncharacterized protein (DUF433 family)
MRFTRITVRADVCEGKPCIRDLRFPVFRLLGLLSAKETPARILKAGLLKHEAIEFTVA